MNKSIEGLLPVYYSCSEAPSGGCDEIGSVPESGIVPTGIIVNCDCLYDKFDKDTEVFFRGRWSENNKEEHYGSEFYYERTRAFHYPRTIADFSVAIGTDGFEMGQDYEPTVKITLSSWSDATVGFIYCCSETYSMYGKRYRKFAFDSRFNPPRPASDWGFELKADSIHRVPMSFLMKEDVQEDWKLNLDFDEKTLKEFEEMAVDEDYPYVGWYLRYSGPIFFTDINGIVVKSNDVNIVYNEIWK